MNRLIPPIGFTGVITVLLCALKLTGVITWSWWVCFAPTLASLALCILALLFCIALTMLAGLVALGCFAFWFKK